MKFMKKGRHLFYFETKKKCYRILSHCPWHWGKERRLFETSYNFGPINICRIK